MARQELAVLKRAATLLHIADLVHYDLCGVAATDWTLGTASQLRNLATGQWDRELLGMMGIPHHLLPRLVEVPSVLGTITAERAPHPRLAGVRVVIGANHDTAAASVATWPVDDETLFLSEGTYAMLGCVSAQPIVSPRAVRAGCAVVGLAGHRWGLFTSLMGLWILQECHRLWEKEAIAVSHAELSRQAENATTGGVIALDQPRFRAPVDMHTEVRQACEAAGVQPPQTPPECARLILDSMAIEHRKSVELLSSLTGRRFRGVRIVSGGSQNVYFCQRLADVLGMPVLAGPTEASALGNIILQAQVTGALAPGEETTRVLEASMETVRYEPQHG
jgi:sugar (pentulose or hexulose) kinase